MRAVITQPPGGWEHTKLLEVPDPAVGSRQCVVAIRAVGLNPADRFLIEGRYPGGPQPPFIAGRDAAGVVQIADLAGRWQEGDEVLLLQSQATDLTRGMLAEQQVVGAEQLAVKPAGWSWEQAAAAPLVYQTAWQALDRGRGFQRGDWVLVTGASGGVGLAAVQLAQALGGRVIALSRAADKREALRNYGAEVVLPPEPAAVKEQVKKCTDGHGVRRVVECVGGDSLTLAVHVVGNGGIIGVVGVLAGVEGAVPIPSLMFKQATLRGILVTGCSAAEATQDWEEIVALLAEANAMPVVQSTFPLADYAAAFEQLSRSPLGKVVVTLPER